MKELRNVIILERTLKSLSKFLDKECGNGFQTVLFWCTAYALLFTRLCENILKFNVCCISNVTQYMFREFIEKNETKQFWIKSSTSTNFIQIYALRLLSNHNTFSRTYKIRYFKLPLAVSEPSSVFPYMLR